MERRNKNRKVEIKGKNIVNREKNTSKRSASYLKNNAIFRSGGRPNMLDQNIVHFVVRKKRVMLLHFDTETASM